MPISKYFNRFRPLQCRECQSTDVKATSSTQFRQVRGKKRQVADVICQNCGHSWWSVHPMARQQARQQDLARDAKTLLSGPKEKTDNAPGKAGKRVRAKRATEGKDFGIVRLPRIV